MGSARFHPRRFLVCSVLVVLEVTAAAAVLAGPAELAEAAGSGAGSITLHVRLNAPRPAEVTEATFPTGRVYLGQAVAFSARIGDGVSHEPLAGARTLFGLTLDAPRQPVWVTETSVSQSAVVLADAAGLAAAEFRTDTALVPGPFVAWVEGPVAPVNRIEYEPALAKAAGILEVWDTTSLSLEVTPNPGKPGEALVSGRLATSHGVGLPLQVSIYIDGSLRKKVTAGTDGAFCWPAGKLAGGLRTFRVAFSGQRYLDGCEAKALFDPSLDNWKVTITAAQVELDLPKTKTKLALTLSGPGWPPANPFSLALVATDGEGKTYPLGEVPATSRQQSAEVELPNLPGLYTVTAEMVDPGPERHNRLDSESVGISIWAPTSLSLTKAAGADGDELRARLTYLARPGEWEWLLGMPGVSITWNGQPFAEGSTDDKFGYFTSYGRPPWPGEAPNPLRPGGTYPFDPGEYQARFNPPAGAYYRPAVSRVVRIGSGLGSLAVRPLIVVVAFIGLLAAGAAFAVAAILRRVRTRRRLAAWPAADEGPAPVLLPPEAIRTLPPREQIVRLYEWLVSAVLNTVLAPDPAWGQWAYWRRLSRALPEAKEPFRNMLVLYQEARYSQHPVAGGQLEDAWRLAGTLRALVSPEGGLAT